MANNPRAAVLSIGNELLAGSTVNRNMSLIGQKLAEFGVEPEIQISVPDTASKLTEALEILSSKPGLVISTGGLGPTSDDITKKVIATFFGLKLQRDKAVEERIRRRVQSYWRDRGAGSIPASVFNQADLLSGAETVLNEVGTAPGFIIRDRKRKLVMLVLPGPPSEAMPMLDKSIEDLVKEAGLPVQSCRRILTSGLPESLVERITEEILGGTSSPLPAYCASAEGTRIYLKSGDPRILLQKARSLERKLGINLITRRAENIFEEIMLILKERGQTISTAESCTGGLLAKRITDIPGSSEVFKGTIVSYDNKIKEKILGVNRKTIRRHGAVSAECAEEMLKGARSLFDTDALVSITGIAGPGGGTKTKPVGLVFIGTSYRGKCEIRRHVFGGTREQVRERAAATAMNQLKQMILLKVR